MDRSKMYQENIGRISKALNRDATLDRVPVVLKMYSWLAEYYGYNLQDFYMNKPEIAVEIYTKGFDEFGYDGIFNLNNVTALASTKALGGGLYTLSDKGIQASNLNAHIMLENEYDLIADDFIGYCRDYILPRRFSKLATGNTNESFGALKEAFEKYAWFMGTVVSGWNEIENNGCPVMWGKGVLLHPIDWIMDYFRDFSGMLADLKRRPEEVKRATDAMQEYFMKNVFSKFKSFDDGHGVFWPMHLAPFLKPKDFEKNYYPYFKQSVEYCIDNKVYAGLFMEGNWEPYFEILQDLPDNNYLIGSMEKGNYKTFKEKMGKKMTLCGGISSNLLAYKSVQECIDFTKQLIDDCADGGGFIVDTDVALLSLNDAKPENLKAIIKTVKEYGKY